MRPSRRTSLALGLSAFVLAAAAAVDEHGIEQPLPFNHALHAEQDLACLDCHGGADEGRYATLPPLNACTLCHEAEELDPEDEPVEGDEEFVKRTADLAIGAFAEELGYIPWVIVNRGAGHVYFSHEAHVAYAGMECADCHGDVASRTEPITERHVGYLTMERCMECHFERAANNDCLACHQ